MKGDTPEHMQWLCARVCLVNIVQTDHLLFVSYIL